MKKQEKKDMQGMHKKPDKPMTPPPEICEIFDKKGILASNIKAWFKGDLGRGLEYCDTWTVLTEDEVAVLESLGGIFEKENKSFLSLKKSDIGIAERDWKVYSLDEWDNFRVEEFVSGGRIVATSKTGNDDCIIANFTNAEKNSAYNFCKRVAGEEVHDTPFEDGTPPMHDGPRGMGGPGGPFGPRGGGELKRIRDLDTKSLFKKMIPFFNRYKRESATVLLMVILSTALGILSPFISGQFFYDEVLADGGNYYGEILFAILLIAGTKLISVVFSMVHSIVTAKISARVVYDLKKTIFTAIQKLSLSYFNMRQSGGIMTQINQDATSIYWFFVDGLPYFITNIVQFIVVVIILFCMNWKISLIVLIPVPIFMVVRRALIKLIRKYHAHRYSRRRSFNSFVSDILVGNRVVKAFSQEDLEAQKFNKKNYALSDTVYYTQTRINWAANIIPAILEIGTWTAWGLGGILVVSSAGKSDAFTYGALVTFVSMLSMAYSPLDFFNRFNNQLSECMNAMWRLFEILEKHSDVPEAENPRLPDKTVGEVEFRNVCFEYVANRRVIDNVSFKVSNGETIGIVGHTGAGKSTLVNLVMRLYDAVDGEVLVDGVNVKDLPTKYIRDHIAIVSQETYVFCGTIADNIRYAVPDATMEEVVAAAKAAGAHDFIIKYPDGYNTKIGTGFRSLSGGELQRVSIARAILKNPTILILDEATAAMDTATELRIQQAITEITRDKTTIIIAHRLSTLRDADRLIVIEDGKMTESGTHEELVRKKGSYYKLYKMQLDALKVIGVEE